jgi:GGDEF domain-containing protein
MPHVISERSERALLSLFPRAAGRADAPSWLVDQLVDAELHRVGHPDPTGAFHALALNQGVLIKEEYDLSSHGHADGWTIEAVLVDPLELTVFNMHHGFPAGDTALRAIVSTMKELSPTAKIVRLHTDGFATLLGPTAGVRLTPALPTSLASALPRAVRAATGQDLRFTVGQLRLTVVDPPNWQVLGPLIWAECERALMIARRLGSAEVIERRVVLDGRLPALPR